MKKYRNKLSADKANLVRNTDTEFNWVKITENHEININGVVRNFKTGRINTPFISNGYVNICLQEKNKKRNYRIHRLLAIAFIENDDIHKTEVDHIDRNPLNNKISNLRWVTKHNNLEKILFSKLCLEYIEEDSVWRLKEDKKYSYYNTIDEATKYIKTLNI